MIRILFFGSNARGGFSVSGHSGFAEEGQDIVCAAVSALTQSAVMGLVDIAGLQINHNQEKGALSCTVRPSGDLKKQTQAEAILGTLVLGLQSIAAQYPQFVELSLKEEET
ncbi:MAG: ribosomal-processing cysteine protease Prp [Christensenellales bacterium]